MSNFFYSFLKSIALVLGGNTLVCVILYSGLTSEAEQEFAKEIWLVTTAIFLVVLVPIFWYIFYFSSTCKRD
jgi:hypothetical protein